MIHLCNITSIRKLLIILKNINYRRQQAGLEPIVKLLTKVRKSAKMKIKSVHNNWSTMLLLMPLYAYMIIRNKLEEVNVR